MVSAFGEVHHGSKFDTPLEWVVSEQMLYRNWLKKYPNGKVLSTDTGFNRNYETDPYQSFFENQFVPYPDVVGDVRDDVPPKAWVYGIVVDEKSLAFPRDELPSDVSFDYRFNGRTLSVLYNEAGQNILITDADTGEVVSGLWSLWFAW